MIVRRILLNNAGPFLAEWEVELPPGVTAVVADYDDAPARSNRAGKSYFAVDAPRYALFGEFRGRADDFVHRLARGREEGFVELEVETSEGRRHVLRRGRDKSGDPIRRLDGARVSERDLVRVVREEILGLSADEYLLTNAFVQGEMHSFMRMTSGEKRKVVSPWFKTDRWVPRAELARKRLVKYQADLRRLDVREEECREQVEAGAKAEERVTAGEAARNDLKNDLIAAMEERVEAKVALDAAAGNRTERYRARQELSRLEAELRAERAAAEEAADLAEKALERGKELLASASGRKDQIERLEREAGAREELRAVVVEVDSALKAAQRESEAAERVRTELLDKYREVEASRTGTCPVLREACDRIESDPAVLEGIKREGLARRDEIDLLKKRLGELGWKLDMSRADLAGAQDSAVDLERLRGEVTVAQAQHTYEAAKNAADAAETAKSNAKLGKTETGKALKRVRRALEKLSGDRNENLTDAAEKALAAAAERVALEEDRLEQVEEDLADARAMVAEVERAWKELSGLDVDRKVTRDMVENLAWSAYAFGATGIPSRELENAFGVAEDAMNSVLSDLGTPLRLRFSPMRELKDWEPGCLACGFVFPKGTRRHVCPECDVSRRRRRRDELRLEVLDGENESTFDLDSGGGKILLSIGGRLGLSSIPGATRRVRCEHLLLDEPDGALDEPNRRALYALLRDRLPDLGIRQAIFITHTDVRDQFDSIVTVRRWADEDRSGVWKD